MVKTPRDRPLTLLQYFTPTPLSVDLCLGSQHVRLETNSREILEKAALICGQPKDSSAGRPQFLWRLVSEDGAAEHDSDEAQRRECRTGSAVRARPSSFGHEGLSFVNFGQRAFLAVDASEKRALGFLPEAWVRDGEGFTGVFLKTLLRLTAAALSNTPESVSESDGE